MTKGTTTMVTRDTPWPAGTPCWVDAQLDDPVAGKEFYSALFGWDIQEEAAEYGGYRMASKDGRAVAGIGPKPEGSAGMPNVWTTYIATDDADACVEAIAAAGGHPMMPAFDVGSVGRMSVAADPTGAVFGIWQAKDHHGVGMCNVPDTLCWNELHTRDYDAAKAFYSAVFGYSYAGMMGAEENGYAVISLPGADGEGIGGICDDTAMPDAPADTPPHWLAWFAVADVDAAVATVGSLGGAALMPPMDMPIGRAAVVAGNQGEVFALIALAPPA